MSTLQDLKQERKVLSDKAQKFFDEHVDFTDMKMSIEDAAVYNRLITKVNSLTDQIEKRERLERVDAENNKPATPRIIEPIDNFNGWSATNGGTQMARKNFSGISDENYRREFVNAIRDNFRHAVTNSYLSEGSLQSGGYLLPSEFDEKIVAALEGLNIMRQICRVITTASEHQIPVVASKPAAAWTAEGEALSFSDEEFKNVTLGAYKLSIGIKVRRELLQDSFYDLEAHIVDQCSAALANSEEQSYLIGDGVGKPTGLLTSLDGLSDAIIETTGTELTCDDLIALEYSLPRPYRKQACFVTSDVAIAQIRRLKDSTGNFLFQPSLTENEPPRLLGYPLFTSQYMPPPLSGAIGVIFGDMKSAYTIADRGERTFQPLHELFAVEDISAYILRERTDGKLVDDKAVKGLRLK